MSVNRYPRSELEAAEYNTLEMALGHSVSLRMLRHGIRVPFMAGCLAFYREKLIHHLEQALPAGTLTPAMLARIRAGNIEEGAATPCHSAITD